MAENKVAKDLDLNNLTDSDIVTVVPEEEKENQEAKVEDNNTAEAGKSTSEEKETPDLVALVAKLEKEIENTNQRYDSSSGEGKRLNDENKDLKVQLAQFDEVKGFAEVLDKYPELREISRQMIQGTYHKLGDESVDLDEAIRNPESNSAKAFNSAVERKTSELIQKSLSKQNVDNKKQSQTAALNREIDTVAGELKLDEKTVDDIISFSRQKGNITFRDMVDLYNIKNSDGKAENGKTRDMHKILDQIKQLSKTEGIDSNIKGGEEAELSLEDSVAKQLRDVGGDTLQDMLQ